MSVRQGDSRVQLQKRLILSNLKEAYELFKQQNPTKTIGFSKFADLRPKHCILAGASGTHSICVCIVIHQNVILMMNGGKITECTIDEVQLDHCLAQIICNPPLPNCYFGDSLSILTCPGISAFREHLKEYMDACLIDNVVYKQWVSVDRSTLETVSKSADDFVDVFCEKLEILLPHSFIAKQQSSF